MGVLSKPSYQYFLNMCGGGPGILHSPKLAGGTRAARSQATLSKSKT